MQLIHTIVDLQKELLRNRAQQKAIGFVPTMGALHQGHLELVKRSVAENGVSIVSIFVNPTQFNDKNDLLKYPRTLDVDCHLLQTIDCDYVFAPSVEEIYPEPDERQFEFGALANVMEGQFRPGHFNGVAQIVSRLFDIVKPDKAYFGEKDFQQLAIIRELVKQLNLNVQIVACPIVREKEGLALSSRNARLTENQRKEALLISKTLFESKKRWKEFPVQALKQWVIHEINAASELQTEYFDIVDGFTLQSIENWEDTEYPVGCAAVFAGEVRLIDNISYL
ncbi:pantothenate synthetase [Bacteroidia bacterium]|nr:pantothenate synthetase [Bacteroidia bacterium]GHT29170.1 pantothenate synthetase [Bacteroidia bacterium]